MKNRQLGLYVNNTTLRLIESASEAMEMNRSEFIRYCVMHVLDETTVLRTRLKERLLIQQDQGAPEGEH